MGRCGQYNKGPHPTYWVRCLGPDDVKEHGFWSNDKTRERICHKCRERIRDKNVSTRLSTPSNVDFDA